MQLKYNLTYNMMYRFFRIDTKPTLEILSKTVRSANTVQCLVSAHWNPE